jgi:hypothetical protein
VFTDDDVSHGCGPREAGAVRGRRYTAVMIWSYTRDGRTVRGETPGSEFTF